MKPKKKPFKLNRLLGRVHFRKFKIRKIKRNWIKQKKRHWFRIKKIKDESYISSKKLECDICNKKEYNIKEDLYLNLTYSFGVCQECFSEHFALL